MRLKLQQTLSQQIVSMWKQHTIDAGLVTGQVAHWQHWQQNV
jgi:hypothetical protein